MAVRTPRRAVHTGAGDRRLAWLASAGDEAAFEAIFERHHRGLLALCRHMLGSLEEAEDAVQHTFAAAFRQLVEREPPEHLRAWLYATARHRCLDVLRARRELPSERPLASTAGLSDEVERRSDLRELVDDIGRLPEDQRAALVMSEIEDLRHTEVAEALGCSSEKVRALVYQARSSLAGWREARALPCREVREELAMARGGALRRGHLRRHLKLCRECAAFREDIERQRRGIAVVIPVLPALGLKERALEAASAAAAGGGGAAAGGAGAGGGLGGTLGAALKIGAAALIVGGGAAGLAGVGPVDVMPLGTPASERSAASAGHLAAASLKADPMSTSRVLRRRTAARAADRARRRTARLAAELERPSAEPPSPEQPSPAVPGPEAGPAPDAVPAPPAPTPPTVDVPPLPDRGALPEAEAELEADPPVTLP